MKVKVSILREEIVEISNPNFNNWIAEDTDDSRKKAIAEVERKVGIPFGDENATETICGVYGLDCTPYLEW